MGLLLAATSIAVFGFSWAKSQGTAGIEKLNQFSNAAGILTRVLTVFDALRQVAIWFSAGSEGSGPLGVPMPARTVQAPIRPVSKSDMSDLYIGQPAAI